MEKKGLITSVSREIVQLGVCKEGNEMKIVTVGFENGLKAYCYHRIEFMGITSYLKSFSGDLLEDKEYKVINRFFASVNEKDKDFGELISEWNNNPKLSAEKLFEYVDQISKRVSDRMRLSREFRTGKYRDS